MNDSQCDSQCYFMEMSDIDTSAAVIAEHGDELQQGHGPGQRPGVYKGCITECAVAPFGSSVETHSYVDKVLIHCVSVSL